LATLRRVTNRFFGAGQKGRRLRTRSREREEAFVCLLVASVGFGIHMLLRGRHWTTQQRRERAVQWWFGGGGPWLLVAASGHLFAADEVAKFLGHRLGCPGRAVYRMRGTFRETFVIGTAIFLWGAAGGHIHETITEDNLSRNNSGLLLAIDVLLPVANAVLLWRLSVPGKGFAAQDVPGSRPGLAPAAD
jgi:hypothetical protein